MFSSTPPPETRRHTADLQGIDECNETKHPTAAEEGEDGEEEVVVGFAVHYGHWSRRGLCHHLRERERGRGSEVTLIAVLPYESCSRLDGGGK